MYNNKKSQSSVLGRQVISLKQTVRWRWIFFLMFIVLPIGLEHFSLSDYKFGHDGQKGWGRNKYVLEQNETTKSSLRDTGIKLSSI